jgi:hypothetical protein
MVCVSVVVITCPAAVNPVPENTGLARSSAAAEVVDVKAAPSVLATGKLLTPYGILPLVRAAGTAAPPPVHAPVESMISVPLTVAPPSSSGLVRILPIFVRV